MALSLQQARTNVRTASGLDGLAGVWQIAAPFILGYSALTAALWNDIITGVAVLLLAASRTMGGNYRVAWPSWINVLIGIWLFFSPFILGYPAGSLAVNNDMVMGVIITILALWSALSTPKVQQM